mmetsp:Transcript_8739/g.15739  ORF Transcript_8739/g.15739 Transcript_8739/m.15739 type:complete len:322 (-) Transcript_8739:195-1160(-)
MGAACFITVVVPPWRVCPAVASTRCLIVIGKSGLGHSFFRRRFGAMFEGAVTGDFGIVRRVSDDTELSAHWALRGRGRISRVCHRSPARLAFWASDGGGTQVSRGWLSIFTHQRAPATLVMSALCSWLSPGMCCVVVALWHSGVRGILAVGGVDGRAGLLPLFATVLAQLQLFFGVLQVCLQLENGLSATLDDLVTFFNHVNVLPRHRLHILDVLPSLLHDLLLQRVMLCAVLLIPRLPARVDLDLRRLRGDLVAKVPHLHRQFVALHTQTLNRLRRVPQLLLQPLLHRKHFQLVPPLRLGLQNGQLTLQLRLVGLPHLGH